MNPADDSSSQSDEESRDLVRRLDISETGVYAYAAICSITLAELFPNDWNKDFNLQYLEKLCQHLKLSEKVKPVMRMLIEEERGQSQEPYVQLLLNEPSLKGKGILIVQDIVLLAVQEGEYDARQRVLVRRISKLLNVPFELVQLYEHSLVRLLSQELDNQSEDSQGETKRRNKIRKIKRYASIGLATIAGGTLIGLTGGLAAPFIGIGVGTILGGASAAAIGSAAGVAIVGSLFGVAGAGLTGYKMNKRVGQIEEFGFEPLSQHKMMDQQLHIAIAVTGWLNDEQEDNVIRPWQSLDVSREQYALRYETKYLRELGQALEYILSIAVSVATQEALKYTILSGLMSAVTWPAALLSIASVIDNPWSVCCRRSSEVGKELAHVLLTRQHGRRPVTLIGFSLGARVIFYCLREMAEIGGGEGIVQDAIMLGAPVTNKKSQWNKCARIVAGQLVNGYCRADWLLGFLYRTLSMTSGVAGLMPIDCPRVSNVDVSSIVSGHMEYSKKLPELLQFVGLKVKEIHESGEFDGMRKSKSALPYDETARVPRGAEITGNLSSSKSDTCLTSKSYGIRPIDIS